MMMGDNKRGRRLKILHNIKVDNKYVATKRATEDKQNWRHRLRKPAKRADLQ